MSLSIQQDFNNYFDMVEDKATTSVFYTDIKNYFDNGKIDSKTFVSIMTEFHKNTLAEAVATAKAMSMELEELEIKRAESVASIAHTNRQTTAIGEELFIKGQDSAKNRALTDERIEETKKQTERIARETTAIGEELFIKGQDSAKNRALIDSNIELNDTKKLTENARKLLINRQREGFDDNRRIKKAEHASGLYGMIESGGNEAPQELVNTVMSSLNNII